MTETVHADYQVSSEGDACKLHWPIPYARLSDATPTPTNAAMVTDAVVGQSMTGTILSIDPTDSIAVVDLTHGAIYRHDVRDCITYDGANNETAWRVINIGDNVYYDNTAALNAAGVYLSTSPLNGVGAANTLFGHVVYDGSAADLARFPLGDGLTPGATFRVAVLQEGA